uniref:DNA/RNA-binding protein Alba-like domain-containing protein n=1 Tax=Timema shepardi TaxID=629360 RepID=A0A7R9AMU4_TIMSH|nr:unnamed protein product [Timema shepardi]
MNVENYSKGNNVEEALSKENIPIPDLPDNFVWMQFARIVDYGAKLIYLLLAQITTGCAEVSACSKMRSVLGFAMKSFKDERCIVWTGSGAAISKTISCAEIMKRRYRNTHQITKIGYRKVEEFWEPQIEDLDPLVVVREIPIIHILLSKDELNSEEPGYVHVLEPVAVEGSCPVEITPPGNTDVFWRAKENTPDSRRGTGKKLGKSPRVSEEQFAALGLRKGPKRAHRNPGGGGGGEHGKAQKGAAAGGEGSDVQDV